jgi:hypothetical protein
MLILRVVYGRPLEPPFAADRDRCRVCPDGLVAGLVIRRLPGWADPASDTIVTVRRRVWGQIWRFGRRVPRLHPAPERFDHGEQHSRDASQRERDSRRQVPVSGASARKAASRWRSGR